MCSIGKYIGEECPTNSKFKNVEEECKEILYLRSGVPIDVISNICLKHNGKFVTNFSNYIKKCVNPLNVHKNTVRNQNLHKLTLEEVKK